MRARGRMGLMLTAFTLAIAAPPSRIIVVGGSSGMGKAAAKAIVARGGRVLIVSRSAGKLLAAQGEVSEHATLGQEAVKTASLDCSDEVGLFL